MNTIYTVKAGNGFGKLSTLEKSIYDFLTSKEFEEGFSISEKQLKKDFAKWNEEKRTVSSIPNENNIKKVCKAIAHDVKEKTLSFSTVPNCRLNKQHGNYSVDFISASKLLEEFTEKEIKLIEKPAVNATEYLIGYMTKHKEDIDFSAVQIALDGLKA